MPEAGETDTASSVKHGLGWSDTGIWRDYPSVGRRVRKPNEVGYKRIVVCALTFLFTGPINQTIQSYVDKVAQTNPTIEFHSNALT